VQALGYKTDVTDRAQVKNVFAASIGQSGSIDVVVANAGGLLKRRRCVETPLELWEQALALNLTSAFLCCQAALKHMEPRGSGALVLVSSLAAFDGGGPGASHYAAAKGAIRVLYASIGERGWKPPNQG
jgi:3-oxoacyl-[acyl-carrier protein] reductase